MKTEIFMRVNGVDIITDENHDKFLLQPIIKAVEPMRTAYWKIEFGKLSVFVSGQVKNAGLKPDFFVLLS